MVLRLKLNIQILSLNQFFLKKYETIIQISPEIKITLLFSIRKSNKESTIPRIINEIPMPFK